MKNDSAISVIAVICVVRVGQHAGNQFVSCGEPLDDFEAVVLVDGEAHGLVYNAKTLPHGSVFFKNSSQSSFVVRNVAKYPSKNPAHATG